jgi:hypothetical protein
MVQHLVKRYGQRCVVAENSHAERIADQQHINIRLIDKVGCRIIVCRDCGDRLAIALLCSEAWKRHFPRGLCRLQAH